MSTQASVAKKVKPAKAPKVKPAKAPKEVKAKKPRAPKADKATKPKKPRASKSEDQTIKIECFDGEVSAEVNGSLVQAPGYKLPVSIDLVGEALELINDNDRQSILKNPQLLVVVSLVGTRKLLRNLSQYLRRAIKVSKENGGTKTLYKLTMLDIPPTLQVLVNARTAALLAFGEAKRKDDDVKVEEVVNVEEVMEEVKEEVMEVVNVEEVNEDTDSDEEKDSSSDDENDNCDISDDEDEVAKVQEQEPVKVQPVQVQPVQEQQEQEQQEQEQQEPVPVPVPEKADMDIVE